MTRYCHINQNAKWEFFPWQKINTRIILIQRKIFEASSQYNLKMLSQAQNYLVNSNEVKLVAIDTILFRINKYYKFHNNEKYSYTDDDKFYILRNLFNEKEHLKTKIKFIIEKIKEYIIYLCIQPEWKARFINYLKYTKQKKNKISQDKYYQNINIDSISKEKFSRFNIFEKNLNRVPYINEYINYWMKNKFFLNSNFYIFKDLAYLFKTIDRFQQYWSYIKLMKSSYLFLNTNYLLKPKIYFTRLIKLLKFNSSKNDDILKKFFNTLKLTFYQKDNINRLKLNKSFNWLLIIQIIIQNLQRYYCLYKELLNSIYFKLIIIKINHLLLHLKLNQHYYLIKNFHFYINLNLYNLLSKKIILQYLLIYLFKVNR